MTETASTVLYCALAVCNFVLTELAAIKVSVRTMESWRDKKHKELLEWRIFSWGGSLAALITLLGSPPSDKWAIFLLVLVGGLLFFIALWLQGWLQGIKVVLLLLVWGVFIPLGVSVWPDDSEPAYRGKVFVQITGVSVVSHNTTVSFLARNIGRYRILPEPWIMVAAIVSPQLTSTEEEEEKLFENRLFWNRGCFIFNTYLEPGGPPVSCQVHPDPVMQASDWDDFYSNRKVLYVLSRTRARDIKGSLPTTDTCRFYLSSNLDSPRLCWDHQK